MIFDAHAHIFNAGIIENVAKKTEMVKRLSLETDEGLERIGVDTLENNMNSANVEACLVLPTANAENVKKVNDSFIEISGQSESIYTACTLHPDYPGNKNELERLKSKGINAIKLCSFSQGFVLNGQKAIDMFDNIRNENMLSKEDFFIVLDTFYNADKFFGTKPKYNTTPALLGDLVRNYPKIKFIGAHMGGLDAPFKEVREHLRPAENFYMDTSNGAHTLSNAEFTELLKTHGPEHILFGTDWPWFGYTDEIKLIERLLSSAGFSESQKASVFRGNIANLLEIS
jgi:predicted TIM-barrel fold metal-dependent hydrolase